MKKKLNNKSTVYCRTCKKDVTNPCTTKVEKSKCLFNKLKPVGEVKPIKSDPDYGK